MRTIELTRDEMFKRVAHFKELEPLAAQPAASVPLAAKDIVYSRKLLSVIGLDEGATPISSSASIRGAAGMTMTLAACPPGQGPELHAHVKTYETFTVLRGRFEFRWNDDGRDRIVLEELDTVSVPPGVCRAFRIRDRGRPYGLAPPTPPYERITYTAVRQIGSRHGKDSRHTSTGASSAAAPTTISSHKGSRPTDAVPQFLGN